MERTELAKKTCLEGGSLGGLCMFRGNFTPPAPGKERTAFKVALVDA